MGANLYKIKEDPAESESKDFNPSFIPSNFSTLRDYILDKLTCCCPRAQSRRRNRFKSVEKARSMLAAELNVLHIVKTLRYSKKALEILLSAKDREKLALAS